jgi:hypothetical protein
MITVLENTTEVQEQVNKTTEDKGAESISEDYKELLNNLLLVGDYDTRLLDKKFDLH